MYVRYTILSHLPTAWLHTPDWTQSQELPENVKYVDRRIINRLITYMNLRSEVLSYHRHTHGMFAEHFSFLFFSGSWQVIARLYYICAMGNPWLYEGFSWQLTGFICKHSRDAPWLDFDMAEAQSQSLHADPLWIPRNFIALLRSEK